MNIIDDHKLLSPQQKRCLEKNSTLPFKFGGFTSIDDILTKLNVNVIIEPGVKTRNQLPSWENMKQSFDEINNHWKNEIDRLDGRRRDDISEELRDLQNIFENHRNEMDELANLPLRGGYNPKDNNITLFPNEMETEYGGTRMEELLVSTLAHETMHAYFNRPGHDSYPYVYFVEEPLAEFGMLLYIHETEHYRNVANQYLLGKNQSDFYQWAYDDVKSKKTCYCYGSTLIDQCLKEGLLSPICAFLVSYKIQIDEYSALYPIKGEIKIPSQNITKSTSVTINGQIVNVRWRDISNLMFDVPTNLPTYFWDDNNHTLGLNGDWTSNNYDLERFYYKWEKMIDRHGFITSRLFKKWENDIELNLYLGDCFNIDNHIIHLFHLKLYGHNSVIVDRLNPFCKIDNNGMARYNNGSLLPIYRKCGKDFYEIRKCSKWGVVKETGEVIVTCKYDYIDFFEDNGLCMVGKDDGNGLKYGFLNEQGKEQIPVVYDEVGNFENGLCKVGKDDGNRLKYGFLNEQGKEQIPVVYNEVGNFENGLCKVGKDDGKGLKYGFLNEQGKEQIPVVYDEVGNFENGLCKVVIKNGSRIHCGFVNEQGEVQIPIVYDKIGSFENGLCVVGKKNGSRIHYGYVNKKGEVQIPIVYIEIGSFKNGICKVRKNDDSGSHYGYVNEQGEVQIPIVYDKVGSFENGVNIAKKDGSYGIIDVKNNIIHPFGYPYMMQWRDFVIMKDIHGKWGAINVKSNVVIPCLYDECLYFDNEGKAKAKKDGKEFNIDSNGNVI